MTLTLYQIDAFTDVLFGGNPAAVIPLQEWISEELMQQLALENNLSETVFFVPSKSDAVDFEIRWFTPAIEINLCGHATLASAYVLFNMLNVEKNIIRFSSKSGILTVKRNNDIIELDFPSWKPKPFETDIALLQQILGVNSIKTVYRYRDILVELENQTAVKNCTPDFTLMKKHFDKMIITAVGDNGAVDATTGQPIDFVSRFFAPGAGIEEDPVTGSAHSQLIPYWSEKLNRSKMFALQLSPRGGKIWCEQISDERVTMSGQAVFYMKGELVVG
ncbi:MAG: PhzF family phenazine biosynthesis protein [Bacteroidetes bacterium]|nr:PhzF family phenazine biosynthesis protein [Bacteroidota bacterium]